MDERELRRKLAAVMAADMVGYSARMEADEVGTLTAHRRNCSELIEPQIKRFNGRLIKQMGDGLLAEFDSVVDAVSCAIAIQTGLAADEHPGAENNPPLYRIGINLGDVISEDGDLFGDGVNIAARLEQLADPGGICISGTAYDHLKSKVAASYQALGEVRVKNIEERVRAYKVLVGRNRPGAPGRPLGNALAAPVKLLLALGLVLAVAAGGAYWWWSGSPPYEPLDPNSMALALPGKPSVAVLPFDDLSPDADQEYFADGITEDLITDLSKVSGLFVIARNSAFAYRDKDRAVREIAEDLGVRYVLEGSVRRSQEQLRINAQLVDVMIGHHVWADRYDGKIGDVFGFQDEVTRQIVSVLSVQLTQSEAAQVSTRSTDSADAYDEFLKGWEKYLKPTPERLEAAISYFEHAVEIDPNYGRAYAALAATYWQISRRFWHAEVGLRTTHDARILAEEMLRAASVHPTPLSFQVQTSMLSQQGRHEEALAAGAQAIGMDPNDADSYVALAGALTLSGKPREALSLIEKAMRLNPHFPPNYLYQKGLAEFCLGNFDEAADALEQATALNPEDRLAYRILIATYGHQGRQQDAERVLAAANKSWLGLDPFTIRATTFWFPFQEKPDSERLVAGLKAAQLPD